MTKKERKKKLKKLDKKTLRRMILDLEADQDCLLHTVCIYKIREDIIGMLEEITDCDCLERIKRFTLYAYQKEIQEQEEECNE